MSLIAKLAVAFGATAMALGCSQGGAIPCEQDPTAQWAEPGFGSVRITSGPRGPLYVGKDHGYLQWFPLGPTGDLGAAPGGLNPHGVPFSHQRDALLAATAWEDGVRTFGERGSVRTTRGSTSTGVYDVTAIGLSSVVIRQVWIIDGTTYASYTAEDGVLAVAGLTTIDADDRVTPLGEPFYREVLDEDAKLAPFGGWDGSELWIDLWRRNLGVRLQLDGTVVETFETIGAALPYFVDQVWVQDRWLGIQAQKVYSFNPRDWRESAEAEIFTEKIWLTSASTLVMGDDGEVWAAASEGGVAIVKRLVDRETLEFEETARVRLRPLECYAPDDALD